MLVCCIYKVDIFAQPLYTGMCVFLYIFLKGEILWKRKYCISEGNYDTQEIPFNSVEVIEDDEFKKPMIIVYAKKAKKNIWSLVFDQEIKHYIIKIPKDSIKNFK